MEIDPDVFAAQRRLLILWLDWWRTGEMCDELVEDTKYLTNYNDGEINFTKEREK